MFDKLKDFLWTKILVLGFVLVVLCIPLGQISGLIDERGASRSEAAAELAQTYAGAQTLTGPFIVQPYTEQWTAMAFDDAGRAVGPRVKTKTEVHLVFPDKLDIQGEMLPEERYRGIFRVLFYKFKGELKGSFPAFDVNTIARSEKDSTITPLAPYIALSLSDVRGLEGVPELEVKGQRHRFVQDIPHIAKGSWLSRGVHAPLPLALAGKGPGDAPLDFHLTMTVVGQERLSIVPIGDETQATLSSQWAHPSFGGRFLAAQRTVSDAGFKAEWNISSLTNTARQQVAAAAKGAAHTKINSNDPAQAAATQAAHADAQELDSFEVGLIQPVNPYSMSDRAIKYSALFVGLVLMAAFMFEIFRKLPLHPVQYGLVGLSIALFFLLLLALSEKLAFELAYGIAASASVLLLFAYFSAVLQGVVRGLSLAVYVALLYASLFVLLVSESNALLLGALLLFGMLAGLMLMTRRINWYALTNSAPTTPVNQA